MGKRLILLLGGARSGKSRLAEQWADEQGQNVLFVATAQAFDADMQERIARHRAERPTHWQTLEAPLAVSHALQPVMQSYDTVVVDCITLLASNVLLTLPEDCTQAMATNAVLEEIEALLASYQDSEATWIVVSNEVGMGIVPPSTLGRLFRDALGRANQRLASVADEVVLLVAGLPWWLKNSA
ncbi:MAG: bifunctional adenosylcobinamide kinase/adenosylcobinamide-phosphate guanylyltransferase [Ardenticatenales bacterium]|nr:bifunctional adenosylcobinamide kinase/adenosylcobinamide-phosphate guanylyltransferase [Ardenticatenales bacterium]